MADARSASSAATFGVPAGHVAAVVTSLEMRRRPGSEARDALPPGFTLEPALRLGCGRYKALFRAVGEDWLWVSRLEMSDDALQVILDDRAVEVLVLRHGSRDCGIVELDFRTPGDCELAFFGLAPDLTGRRIGRTLMTEAIRRAWSRPIERFWVHTCTHDHPAALLFYVRFGFTPVAVAVEVTPDPRLSGLIPVHCAPHVPIVA